MPDIDVLDCLPVPTRPHETALSCLEKVGLTAARLTREVSRVDPAPSPAQQEAGNYQKGHVSWKGLDITIETGQGQYRRGVAPDGTPWQTLMRDSYGYVRGTEANDGDHVDVFLCREHLDSEVVFVINQNKPGTDTYDEPKGILGVTNIEDARRIYLAHHYERDWTGLGSIVPMTLAQFKWWLTVAHRKQPIKEKFWLNTKTAADDGYRIVLVKYADDDPDMPFYVAVDLDGTLAEELDPFDPKKIGAWCARQEMVRRLPRSGGKDYHLDCSGQRRSGHQVARQEPVGPSTTSTTTRINPPGSSGKIFAHVYWDNRGA